MNEQKKRLTTISVHRGEFAHAQQKTRRYISANEFDWNRSFFVVVARIGFHHSFYSSRRYRCSMSWQEKTEKHALYRWDPRRRWHFVCKQFFLRRLFVWLEFQKFLLCAFLLLVVSRGIGNFFGAIDNDQQWIPWKTHHLESVYLFYAKCFFVGLRTKGKDELPLHSFDANSCLKCGERSFARVSVSISLSYVSLMNFQWIRRIQLNFVCNAKLLLGVAANLYKSLHEQPHQKTNKMLWNN